MVVIHRFDCKAGSVARWTLSIIRGKCKALWGKPQTLLRLSQRSNELSCTRFDEERSKKSKVIDEQRCGTVCFSLTHQPTHEFDCRTSSGCRCLWGTQIAGMPGLVIVLDQACACQETDCIFRVWVRDGASGPGPGLVYTLCYAENSDARLSFVTLSSSPVACILFCKNLSLQGWGFLDFSIGQWFFFFLSKESYATGAQTLRKPDSRSTCTSHHMRPHCWSRRNQHCKKSLESLLIGKTEIFRDEHERGCRSSALPGCDQFSPSCSSRAAFRELKAWAAGFFFFLFLVSLEDSKRKQDELEFDSCFGSPNGVLVWFG